MSISITNLTVAPTARPWNFAAIAAVSGTPTTEVGYNVNFTDGSNGGGSGSQNQGFAYGKLHATAGETGPHTVAVTPGKILAIQYVSGTVKTNPADTAWGPIGDGSGTTGISPTIDYADTNGYVYPTDCMPAAHNLFKINPTNTSRVGLVGAFTDSSGNLIANSFWHLRGFAQQNNTFTSCAAASGNNQVFTGTITGGTGNTYGANLLSFVTITGFTNAANNGTFFVVASTATTLTVQNPFGVVETAAGAGVIGIWVIPIPSGAAFITMGINDTQLADNVSTGFNINVVQIDSGLYSGGPSTWARYPWGQVAPAYMADNPSVSSTVFMGAGWTPQYDTSAKGLGLGYTGQLFPHGAQNTGGAPAGSNGQNFPY